MSFEGYYQKACARGHRWDDDCLAQDNGFGQNTCPDCGLPPIFENVVDETNCEADGYLTSAQIFSKLKWGGPDL
jgi:hypothetical protein